MLTIRRSPLLLIGVSLIFALLAGNRAQGQNTNPLVRAKNPTLVAEQKDNQANLVYAPVTEVIDLLEQLTGKHFIRDFNLSGVPPVSVNGTGLTKDEFARLITATLLLNGVAIIPVDDQTMKVVTVGTNKNPRCEGLRVYSNEADLPADDQIVTYVMPLNNISPEEAAAIFVQVAPVHVYGAYVPAISANAIILTENVSVIRELIALKKGIDVRNPNPPRPPLPGPPGPPGQGPRPGHPHPPIGGLVILAVVVLLASALGNFLAHLWLGRSKAKQAN